MFEVGKKVICIKTHTQGVVKAGQVFDLMGIRKSDCKCSSIQLDIGLKNPYQVGQRVLCQCGIVCIETRIYWLGSTLFAPYDDSLSSITADELIESLEYQTV